MFVTCTRTPSASKRLMSFRGLQNHFNNPPQACRPLTRWIWNVPVTPEEIDFQLSEFKDKNLGGVIIYPEEKILPELSADEWRDLLCYAKVQADSLGLKIWINDNLPPLNTILDLSRQKWSALPDCYTINTSFTGNVLLKDKISTFHQCRKTQAIAALFLNTDPGLSFLTMKDIGDRAFVCGFEGICFGQSLYSILGSKIYEAPSFSYHAPWWDLFPSIVSYFSRLSLVLSSGDPIRNVLVFHYSEIEETALSADSPSDEDQMTFQSFFELLTHGQVEFDLATSTVLEKFGSAKHGEMKIGSAAYSCVILPPGMQNLRSSTVNLIENYLRSGGKVIYFTPPVAIEGKSSTVFQTWPDKYPSEWIHIQDPGDPDFLKEVNPPDFRIVLHNTAGHQFYHQRRSLSDGQLLFLVNNSSSNCVRGHVQIPGEAVYRLNALQGIMTRYPFTVRGMLSAFDFNLLPFESLLVFSAARDTFGIHITDEKQTGTEKVILKKGKTIFTPGYLNSIVLNRCNLFSDDKQYQNCSIGDAGTLCPDHLLQIQFPVSIHKKVNPLSMMIVIQIPNAWNVYVNDRLAEQLRDAWLLDRGFGVYNIGTHIQPERNTISLIPVNENPSVLPAYLYGDFSLIPNESGWRIVPPRVLGFGSWSKQGMPFYSDAVSYIQSYSIQRSSSRYKIQLGSWQGTVSAVRINDLPAGIIAWPPYSLDVTEYIRDGLNDVEVAVYGSLKNIFPKYEKYDQKYISGTDSIKSYGLLEGFELVEILKTDSR
ncbi:hypothetical protein JW835_05415 [bacterium]|nr:hypothetical protein [bacterium]